MWHTQSTVLKTQPRILVALVCALVMAMGGVVPAQAAGPTGGALSQRGQPVRLIIPSLEIDAPLEAVGQDDERVMAAPSDVDAVAWYNQGPMPGEPGNAVMAGHLDDVRGRPAIFWRLDELAEGDAIIVRFADAREVRFEVLAVETYDADDAPLERIFGVDFNRDLNLITCDGAWNAQSKLYERRLVVYARRVMDDASRVTADNGIATGHLARAATTMDAAPVTDNAVRDDVMTSAAEFEYLDDPTQSNTPPTSTAAASPRTSHTR